MAKRRSDAAVVRMLMARIDGMDRFKLAHLRNRLTRHLIARYFKFGWTVDQIAGDQRIFDDTEVERELRAFMLGEK